MGKASLRDRILIKDISNFENISFSLCYDTQFRLIIFIIFY